MSTMDNDTVQPLKVNEESLRFHLERDLQSALRESIKQLDPCLTIIDGGTERTVYFGNQSSGRIDILAQDENQELVVIELKAGMADTAAVSQISSYIEALKIEEDPPSKARGILIAQSFSDRAKLAAKSIPSLTLISYGFQFIFQTVQQGKERSFRFSVTWYTSLLFLVTFLLMYFI